MPCKIPSHILDIDEATAERLARRIILRRRTAALVRFGVLAVAFALAGVAVAAAL
jgi:hypothetical protein